MYAFVVNELWIAYEPKDIAMFLRNIGTPSLKMDSGSNDTFNESSGFYVKVQPGWFVRFKSQLVSNDANLLAAFSSMGLT